jgi:hypothetical protein
MWKLKSRDHTLIRMQQFYFIDGRRGHFEKNITFKDFMAAHGNLGTGFTVFCIIVAGSKAGTLPGQ